MLQITVFVSWKPSTPHTQANTTHRSHIQDELLSMILIWFSFDIPTPALDGSSTDTEARSLYT